MTNTAKVGISSAVLALAASACFVSTDVEPDREVGVTEQALGGYTEVVNLGAGEVMDIGPTYTVVRRGPAACHTVDVYMTTTGQQLSVPPLPGIGCRNITAATSRPWVLVADQSVGKIYVLVNGFVPPPSWLAVDSSASNVAQLFANDTHLFWKRSQTAFQETIHKVNLGTGVKESWTVGGQFTLEIMDVEGANLYLWRSSFASGLERLSWPNGQAPILSPVATTARPNDFSFDANYFWWTASIGGTNYIRRLAKAGNAYADYRTSTTVRYWGPVSSGSALWWVEENVSSGAGQIKRKNLVNGNQNSAAFSQVPPRKMRLLPDGLYYVHSADSTNWSLYRTQR